MVNFELPIDPALLKHERAKAREIRASQWWRNQIGKGQCHYCQQKFPKELLTMDHVIPVARGGKSSKSNIVVACKDCNSKKKNLTPVEMTMQAIEAKLAIDSFES